MDDEPTHCPDGHALVYPDVKVGFGGCDCPGARHGGHRYQACLVAGCRWEWLRGHQPQEWVRR
jgi:hypothetical protein